MIHIHYTTVKQKEAGRIMDNLYTHYRNVKIVTFNRDTVTIEYSDAI